MASKCEKCGSEDNYNFILNIGLCNPCIGEQITELKIENAKLNIILFHRENGLSHPDFNTEIEISKQAEQIELIEKQCQENGHNAATRLLKIDKLQAQIAKLIEGQQAKAKAGSTHSA